MVGFAPTNLVYRISQEIHNEDIGVAVLIDSTLWCNWIQRSAMSLRKWIGAMPMEISRDLCAQSYIMRYVSLVFDGDVAPFTR